LTDETNNDQEEAGSMKEFLP